MENTPTEIRVWLLQEFGSALAMALEGVTGERPGVVSSPDSAPPNAPGLAWRQPFNSIPGAMWIAADDASWRGAGGSILRALELEETEANLRSEYLEVMRQGASGLASAITAKRGYEVSTAPGEQSDPNREAAWGTVEITMGETVVKILVGFEPELFAALSAEPEPDPEPETSLLAHAEPTAQEHAQANSKTFGLLLDLELPVSISFGRAQVALKNVLKLNIGSIVELNRAIGDPVEVIVNNCVIARGQVVVIDGNFGVRIQNVISTQERLRSLN